MTILILVDCRASHTEPASRFWRVCVLENDFSPSVDGSERLSGPGGPTWRPHARGLGSEVEAW